MSEVAEVVRGQVVDYGSLAENEAIVRKHFRSFVEVGRALARIRDDRQYVMAGFDTFEDYCRDRLDLGKGAASQYISAVRVHDVVHARELPPPATEFVARPLVKVLNEQGDEAVVSAWSQIVEGHDDTAPISGREVARFLKVGGGANYGKPGWSELLGEVGDTLIRVDRQLTKVEDSLTRKPNEELRAKAGKYALWAADLAERLRRIEDA